jgi:alkylhydroperoxidase family enzyme
MIYEGKPARMYLPDVEDNPDVQGPFAELIRSVRETGGPLPQIWHLFAFNPAATKHLERFTQAVMREPGPLTPGLRELIAAYTSSRNQCPF